MGVRKDGSRSEMGWMFSGAATSPSGGTRGTRETLQPGPVPAEQIQVPGLCFLLVNSIIPLMDDAGQKKRLVFLPTHCRCICMSELYLRAIVLGTLFLGFVTVKTWVNQGPSLKRERHPPNVDLVLVRTRASPANGIGKRGEREPLVSGFFDLPSTFHSRNTWSISSPNLSGHSLPIPN
jgi:hypothetical protein